MISFYQVSKYFGELTAVKSISFEVAKGENMILLGTSGCGKTTTLKMTNRLLEPTSGRITIEGQDVSNIAPEKLRRKTGYVIQNTGLFPHYTIKENIAVVPRLLKWSKEKMNKSINNILEKVHLPEVLLNKYPNELSGGQQQRVGLARALITDPPVVLMDEPLGALDPITRKLIRKEFITLEAIKDKTIMMVTHDVEEAFELGDTICLMDKGTIQQIGTPQELLFKPKNEFVQHFFDLQRHNLQMKSINLESLELNLYRKETVSEVNYFIDSKTPVYDLLNSMAGHDGPLSIEVADNQEYYYLEISQQDLFNSYQKAIKKIYNG